PGRLLVRHRVRAGGHLRAHLPGRRIPRRPVARADVLRADAAQAPDSARATAEAGVLPSASAMKTDVSTTASRSTPVSMPSPRSIHTRSSVARLPVALFA